MYPTLLSIGNFAITTFGTFLLLAFFAALFIIWRLARVYDFDREKILDLFLITTIFSLIGSRIVFVLENLSLFHSFSNILALNRYPGLSFWGGFAFGLIIILVTVRKLKLQFWQVGDIAIVGLMLGLSLGSLGCLLSSCQSGYQSNFILAVNQIGLIGSRFPIQAIEAIIYAFLAWYFWGASLRFHFVGKIATFGLFMLGLVNFVVNFYRSDSVTSYYSLKLNQWIALAVLVIGLFFYLRLSRRSLFKDFRFLLAVIFKNKTRQLALLHLRQTCYNLIVHARLSFSSARRGLIKKINVRPTPKKF